MNAFRSLVNIGATLAELISENKAMAALLKKYERPQEFNLREELIKASERHGVDHNRYYVSGMSVDSRTGVVVANIRNILDGTNSLGAARCNFSEGDVFNPCRGMIIAIHKAVQKLPEAKS